MITRKHTELRVVKTLATCRPTEARVRVTEARVRVTEARVRSGTHIMWDLCPTRLAIVFARV